MRSSPKANGGGEAPGTAPPLLEVSDLSARYGPVRALHGAGLEVRAGEVVCVLGVNGAGKTTLLSAIAGTVRPTEGRVRFEGTDVVGRRPEDIVRRGVALVPEGRQVFPSMSVRDNLLLGGYPRRRDRVALREGLDEVFGLFPVLSERAELPAGTLSGGEQQMLAIGRALMGRPRLLMLDEPSLGLAPQIVQRLMGLLGHLAQGGRAILLVEQLARLALGVAGRGYLLERGRVALSGSSEELQGNDRVREIYMGVRR